MWIKLTRRKQIFNTVRNKIFEPITAMVLEGCTVLDTESGWVSDNYLAFCRLCKRYYSPFHCITEDIHEEPTIPIKIGTLITAGIV